MCLSLYISLSIHIYIYICIYMLQGLWPPMSMWLPPPLWGGVGLELITYPHNMALTCRRTHLPTAPPEQGILSLKLLQRTMSLEKLRSRESLLKSSISIGNPSSRSRPHDIGGRGGRGPQPLAPGTYIYIYIYIILYMYFQYSSVCVYYILYRCITLYI